MLVIPAIDIKDGKCVRLRRGDMDDATVFADDPVAMADRWVAAGARRLHVVDLDGATTGKPVSADIIAHICEKYPNVPLQVGGGIRDEDTIERYIESGARYVILGTKAVKEPHFVSDLCAEFTGHIIVGLDVKEGRLAVDGWSKLSGHDLIDLAQHFENDGIEAIVYTDVQRDGMLSGVNIETTVALAEAVRIPVIAAGGVHDLEDVRRLCAVADSGITGAITGRAIYAGTLDFAAAQALADELDPD